MFFESNLLHVAEKPECSTGHPVTTSSFPWDTPLQEIARSLRDMGMHFHEVRNRLQRPEFLASTLLAPVLTKYTMSDECKRAAFRRPVGHVGLTCWLPEGCEFFFVLFFWRLPQLLTAVFASFTEHRPCGGAAIKTHRPWSSGKHLGLLWLARC